MRFHLRYLCAVLIVGCAAVNGRAATVWSGLTTEFAKPAFADPTLPENQDRLTPRVALTRGSSAGLYNAAQEAMYSGSASPADTEWATALNNPDDTIAAANWPELTFTTWVNAYGGPGQLGVNIVGRDAVVHLITDDIYLDIRFTDWGGFGGGSFAYRRAVPEPSAMILVALATSFLAVRRR